jgi:hypothetical protein
MMPFPKKQKRTRCSRKTKLRQEAAYRECMVRLPGCLDQPTVLAHIRESGISGMGLKAHDFQGAWACDNCHRAYDTRGSGPEADAIELAFLHGVMRTQDILAGEGKLGLLK